MTRVTAAMAYLTSFKSGMPRQPSRRIRRVGVVFTEELQVTSRNYTFSAGTAFFGLAGTLRGKDPN